MQIFFNYLKSFFKNENYETFNNPLPTASLFDIYRVHKNTA